MRRSCVCVCAHRVRVWPCAVGSVLLSFFGRKKEFSMVDHATFIHVNTCMRTCTLCVCAPMLFHFSWFLCAKLLSFFYGYTQLVGFVVGSVERFCAFKTPLALCVGSGWAWKLCASSTSVVVCGRRRLKLLEHTVCSVFHSNTLLPFKIESMGDTNEAE